MTHSQVRIVGCGLVGDFWFAGVLSRGRFGLEAFWFLSVLTRPPEIPC